MIVLDVSAVVDLLLNLKFSGRIYDRVKSEPGGLAAPHLLDAEVGQVLRRQVQKGLVPVGVAHSALANLADLPLVRFAHTPLMERAFELRENITVYDGLYVALAEVLDAPLITLDAALAHAPGHRARVELIS